MAQAGLITFALHAATTRQRHYAELLGSEVYTPQLVVDGRAETVGSYRPNVEALLKHPHPITVAATVRESDGKLAIHVDGSAVPAANAPADILLVTFDPKHETPVRGGENGGRSLATYNDVRSLRIIGRWQGDAVSMEVPLQQGDLGARAAIIVQAADGAIWALAATPTGALE